MWAYHQWLLIPQLILVLSIMVYRESCDHQCIFWETLCFAVWFHCTSSRKSTDNGTLPHSSMSLTWISHCIHWLDHEMLFVTRIALLFIPKLSPYHQVYNTTTNMICTRNKQCPSLVSVIWFFPFFPSHCSFPITSACSLCTLGGPTAQLW